MLNSKTEEVSQKTRNSGVACKLPGGSSFPELEQPHISILRPGFETTFKYFNDMSDSVKRGWSSEFKKLFDAMAATASTPPNQ